jgi:hypothetical protein
MLLSTRLTPISNNTRTAFTRLALKTPTQQQLRMSSSQDFGQVKLESTNIKTASGVDLSNDQRTLVSVVLDLFAGRPSLAKLQLWSDDGVFQDPITIAEGRKQYEAQWVSLASLFVCKEDWVGWVDCRYAL